ncbi:histidine phosphatase family protein [Cellulosilyticum sp. I15G10I2]|uniref:histidine phosphatase family protein n=1 Tax=Cellulosilyticum sp. I15G10I2 TaxID=1892843 RepID=UPI00085C4DEB|nr:histidine phosphatase family protein [Cellulosilyticum sp. I15G10I2]
MLKLILVRHATTKANEHKVFSGFYESEIGQKGIKEIEVLTKKIEDYTIDTIYASPSTRTIKTVQAIANKYNKEIYLEKDLREICFGDFEGLGLKEVEAKYPEEISKMIELGDDYSYPAGESLIQSYKRTAKWVDQMKQIHNNQTVLVCAHAGTIRNILSHLICQSPKLHWHFKIDNASLTIVTIDNDFAVVEALNNTSFINNMV